LIRLRRHRGKARWVLTNRTDRSVVLSFVTRRAPPSLRLPLRLVLAFFAPQPAATRSNPRPLAAGRQPVDPGGAGLAQAIASNSRQTPATSIVIRLLAGGLPASARVRHQAGFGEISPKPFDALGARADKEPVFSTTHSHATIVESGVRPCLAFSAPPRVRDPGNARGVRQTEGWEVDVGSHHH